MSGDVANRVVRRRSLHPGERWLGEEQPLLRRRERPHPDSVTLDGIRVCPGDEALQAEVDAEIGERDRQPIDRRTDHAVAKKCRRASVDRREAMRLVCRIACEDLVPPVARQGNGDRASREAR